MKKTIISFAIAVAMAGCSRSDTPEVTKYEASDMPIAMGGGVQQGSSRTPVFVGGGGATFNLTARVIGSLGNTNFASHITNADDSITFVTVATPAQSPQSNSVGFTTPAYYPINPATPVYLLGLYPATGWTMTLSYTFNNKLDGKTDIMVAKPVATTRQDAKNLPTTYKNLTFEHALTLLRVSIVASSSAAITYWGNVTGIVVKNAGGVHFPAGMANTVFYWYYPANFIQVNQVIGATVNTYNYTGSDPYSSSSYTNTSFSSATLTTASNMVSYSMVESFSAVAGDNASGYTLRVTTQNGGSVDVPVTINALATGSTAGQAFDITLTFGASQIMATATVADWKPSGTGSTDIY